MRRTLATTATVLALFTLSGCFKLDMDMTVNSDDTLDGVVIFALDEELAGMAEEDSDFSEEELPEGATLEDYEEDGFVGQKITLDGVTMAELNEGFSSEGDTGGPSAWELTHEGDTYRFTGDMDMTEMAGSGEEDIDMGAFMQGAELRISLTFPGEVTESNGEVDGNTVTWEPEIGEVNEMTAVAEEGSGLSTVIIALIVGGVVVVLAVAAALLLLARRRKGAGQTPAYPAPADAHAGPQSGPPTGLS
jgi:hypothetical protein